MLELCRAPPDDSHEEGEVRALPLKQLLADVHQRQQPKQETRNRHIYQPRCVVSHLRNHIHQISICQ